MSMLAQCKNPKESAHLALQLAILSNSTSNAFKASKSSLGSETEDYAQDNGENCYGINIDNF